MLHPNSLFKQYKEKIYQLENFDNKNIQTEQFLMYRDPKIQIYYAPHNEFINDKAKVFIIGITPGWSQTQIAYQTAKDGLEKNDTEEEICFKCKMNSRFAGTMRKNIISMLDELELNKKLGLDTCNELFNPECSVLHTTSLIKYPCFYKGKNYNGHTPTMNSVPILKKYIQEEFIAELHYMNDIRLIIPLGTAVEEILKEILEKSTNEFNKVLWGFPHPSGLNGRRKIQFAENKDNMLRILGNMYLG